jgi:hypothetical protein
MIVYNVARRWYAEKTDAEKYRKLLGLKPSATIKVTVKNRGELSQLLDALCEPPVQGHKGAGASTPEQNELIDRAYVAPHLEDFLAYVPRFLLDDEGQKLWDERHLK